MKKEMKYNVYEESFNYVKGLLEMDREEFKKLNWKKGDILYNTIYFYDDEIFTAVQLVVGDDDKCYIKALLGKDKIDESEEDVLIKLHENIEALEILTTIQTDTIDRVINLIYGEDNYEITMTPYIEK